MELVPEIEKKLKCNRENVDYVMLNPMQKNNIPEEWRKVDGLEICGIKIIWNIANKDDEIIFLKKV